MPSNLTTIPAPRVPLINADTGLIATEWYRFLFNLYTLSGSGSNVITLDELQIGPPAQPTTTTGGGSMVYPGAGIANSTGSAWTTSYSTTGTGSVVALQTGPTLSAPIIDGANPYIQFNNGSAVTVAAGKLWYDGSTGSWNAGMGGGNITQQIGEELFVYGKASAAITDSPLQIVYHTGTVGASGVITFAPTIAGITDENAIVGVATENIAHNGFGRVTTFGVVRGITTNGTAFGETWADDDVIWYNPVTGNPTNVKPSAPNIKFQIGLVIKAGAGGSGSFQVALVQGTALGGTDSNVKITSVTNGNLLTYDGGNGYWKNTDLTAGTGISVSKSANGVLTVTNTSPSSGGTVTSVTGTAPVVSSGGNTPAISMAAANTTTNGYLTSTDWNTFNNKGSGSVTSVAATVPSFLSITGSPITTSGTLAISYSGTALPILNGGTGQTTASAAFNALSPLTTVGDTLYGGTSGAGTRLAIGTAGQVLTVNAGATAPQWSTPTTGTVTSVSVVSANGFAGTVATATTTPAITVSTSITGVLKGNGTAISAATAGTDYSAGTSANTSGLVYSTTTTGALTTATGAQISTALGTTAISGNAANVTGTVAVANGGTGQTAALVAGAIVYGFSTTAMAVTAAGTAGQVLTSQGAGTPTWTTPTTGTVTSVTGTSPVVSSGGATPAISMPAATTSVNGYLTSADWTTFNGKQAALVSGTNIKTVNGNSLLGSGDVGTIGIAYGGTGQITANAAYNALSPMTTTGDIEYRTAGSVAARLGIGTTGQVLTVVAGLPAWAAASGGGSNITTYGLWENSKTISANYSITSGNSATSAGPITINSGVSVTVPSGSRWVVL